MAQMMKSAQDVYYYFDDQGRACVDLFAKALDVVDGNNPDCWKYDIVQKENGLVHHARLLGDSSLEVKAEHSPVYKLTPMTQYNVYFNFTLLHNATGFKRPVMFEFSDQNGSFNRFPLQLRPGVMNVLVGQFITVPGFQNVKAKMYDFNAQEKSGLLVRCVSIMPADD